MKKISWEEDFIHEINLCCVLNKTNTTNITIHDFFFITKFAMLKKIRSVSKKNINKILFKKFRFTSKEDANQFLFWEKFKSASKEDADPFLFWEKFRPASNEDSYPFLFKKNSDLHLRKM